MNPKDSEHSKHFQVLQQKEQELLYEDEDHAIAHGVGQPALQRHRTLSMIHQTTFFEQGHIRKRRSSHDEQVLGKGRRFLINVQETQRMILAQEDTDGDFQITIQDVGPKSFVLGTANSSGFKKFEIRGTYMLSNLLQELTWAMQYGRQFIVLDEDRLNENPVARMHRLIKYHFWDGLTRRIDAEGLEIICNDPKNRSSDQRPRIYIPYRDTFAYDYFTQVAESRPHLKLDVVQLPEHITPEYVKSIDGHPGILSLGLRKTFDPKTNGMIIRGTPFVVPGGRFNEMYGWDSYFETLGLIEDGRLELARAMVDNFCYEIEHYGKILNANRSYYLTRSQPPFLTDMIKCVFDALCERVNEQRHVHLLSHTIKTRSELMVWLRQCIRAAIKELLSVWLSFPRLDPHVGLSKYHTDGIGMPPETESTHFNHILEPFAEKYGVDVETFKVLYDTQKIKEPELDLYFIHDRAVRESGHDTTYRFEGRCAYLATIDLNSLIYKYEDDLAGLLEHYFNGRFKVRVLKGPNNCFLNDFLQWMNWIQQTPHWLGNGSPWNCHWAKAILVYEDIPENDCLMNELPVYHVDESLTYFDVMFPSTFFKSLAKQTQQKVNDYLWNDQKKLYYDYDCHLQSLSVYDTVTCLWAMWAGLASPEKAHAMVPKALSLFEVVGGLVSGTEESRGRIGLDRPNRQWDFPYGWAPHQIMAWKAMKNYGFDLEAERLAYRWLYTLVKSFVDFNGVVPEKFDVVNMTHKVTVEYGNVGADFQYVVREGFGWMNASFQIGLTYLSETSKKALGALVPPDDQFQT